MGEGTEKKTIFERLAEPFPPEYVYWMPGATNRDKTKALALAHLDARGPMDRLDDVMGPENWRDHYEAWGAKGVRCMLSLRVSGEWIAKEDAADESDIEGTKGGISGALKRAAVKWGIGRYLYYLPSEWVPYDAQKKRIVTTPTLPGWALPGGAGRPPAQEVKQAVGRQASGDTKAEATTKAETTTNGGTEGAGASSGTSDDKFGL